MADSYEGQLPYGDLGKLRIDEEMWGDGAEPVVRAWLVDHYDPDEMPKLQLAQIDGREGLWLLGWDAKATPYPSLLELIFGEDYADQRLEQHRAGLIEQGTILCPRCRFNRFTPYGSDVRQEQVAEYPFPALSRMDNETYICSPCGTDEAMRDHEGAPPIPIDEWPVYPTGTFGQGRL